MTGYGRLSDKTHLERELIWENQKKFETSLPDIFFGQDKLGPNNVSHCLNL